MKFSLSWIAKHIQVDWHRIEIAPLVQSFNRIVAEIEQVKKVEHDLESLTIARVMRLDGQSVHLFSPEWDQELTLTPRDGVMPDQWFLVKKTARGMRWAVVQDIGSDKDSLVPAVQVRNADQRGAWKNAIPAYDYILEVDNKSITHRPDLWGHRGMAREISALLQLPLRPLEHFLADMPEQQGKNSISSSVDVPFALSMTANVPCSRVAAVQCTNVQQQASSLAMIFALSIVDSRPINALVDLTNYVMFDLGSPMHVFDATLFATGNLEVRLAKNAERLKLLDGDVVELTDQDLVITNGEVPVSLAGVMGGDASAVTMTTASIVVEAGCFDAATVRKTAARFKKRTDASARFEKSLDANTPVLAVKRFMALAREQSIIMHVASPLLVVGSPAHHNTVELTHVDLEQKVGVSLAREKVLEILTRLEFDVQPYDHTGSEGYRIVVPTFRSTKDVFCKEDIVEEVARFYGYNNIPSCLPAQTLKPWDIKPLMRIRQAKQCLAYGLSMQEVYNYALYDEQFLKELSFEPEATTQVRSPVSENWRRLVTSLMPHLLKNVVVNKGYSDLLRFFEWGRVWQVHDLQLTERRVLAGVVVDQKNSIDFYQAKQEMQRLCDALDVSVSWMRCDEVKDPWFVPYESAYIMHEGTCIGRFGKLDTALLHRVVQGDGFGFELDGEFLMNYTPPIHKFKPLSKYPEIVRDISMFVSSAITVDQVAQVVKESDPRIAQVILVDFFESKDDAGRKALTIRSIVRDETKTLTKEEIDEIMESIIAKLTHLGASIR